MKKYKIIYADPPWRYARSKVQGAAEKHYPTMSIAVFIIEWTQTAL